MTIADGQGTPSKTDSSDCFGIELADAIQMLSRLNTKPADLFKFSPTPPVTIDLSISKIGKHWIISGSEEGLPKLRLRTDYGSISPSCLDEKQMLRTWLSSGKSLLYSLQRRREILLKIGSYLVQKQAAYLDQKGPLQPLTLRKAAEELHLHESTLSRALSGKFMATPRGNLPMRCLFTEGNEEAKAALKKLVLHEDKKIL